MDSSVLGDSLLREKSDTCVVGLSSCHEAQIVKAAQVGNCYKYPAVVVVVYSHSSLYLEGKHVTIICCIICNVNIFRRNRKHLDKKKYALKIAKIAGVCRRKLS